MKKTILITGSTDGIGKLAAIQLAKEGHKLLLHGRTLEKLNFAIAEVQAASDNTDIYGYLADFSDLDNIEAMAHKIKLEHNKIDVLINNAGVFKSPNQTNKDGIDLRLVVNYLSPVLLTQELLPLMHKSDAARIINLSSAAQGTLDLNALLGKSELNTQAAYAQSKLALTMWSFELSKMENNLNIIAVNPGSLLDTKMAHEAYGQFWASADKGANILYDLAVSENYTNSSGLYYDNDNGGFAEAHADAYDQSKINALMNTTYSILAAQLKHNTKSL